MFLPYKIYVSGLKWLTLALVSYVAQALSVRVDWWAVASSVLRPQLAVDHDMLLMVVAVFGTTISPYLFFWQAAQEMEDNADNGPHLPGEVRRHLRRIKADTIIGMGFSNLIAFSIILSTAATLHAAGVTDIQTCLRHDASRGSSYGRFMSGRTALLGIRKEVRCCL